MAVVSVTLYRYAGENQVVGSYMGYKIISSVAVEKSLTLRAENEKQLAAMINIASIDGWRIK